MIKFIIELSNSIFNEDFESVKNLIHKNRAEHESIRLFLKECKRTEFICKIELLLQEEENKYGCKKRKKKDDGGRDKNYEMSNENICNKKWNDDCREPDEEMELKEKLNSDGLINNDKEKWSNDGFDDMENMMRRSIIIPDEFDITKIISEVTNRKREMNDSMPDNRLEDGIVSEVKDFKNEMNDIIIIPDDDKSGNMKREMNDLIPDNIESGNVKGEMNDIIPDDDKSGNLILRDEKLYNNIGPSDKNMLVTKIYSGINLSPDHTSNTHKNIKLQPEMHDNLNKPHTSFITPDPPLLKLPKDQITHILAPFLTHDPLKDRLITAFYDAMCTNTTHYDYPTIANISQKLVTEIHNTNRHKDGEFIRSKILNLKNSKNPELCDKVVRGILMPAEYLGLSNEEMKSSSLRMEEERIVKDSLMDMQVKKIEAETDMFRCSRCKNRKTTYAQLQTRSADEPMTTFVTCVVCRHRWKF